MKVLAVTEFYSQRGGGVRSHLTQKGQSLCQAGHEHVVVAPGPHDETRVEREASSGSAKVVRVKGPALPYDPTYHLLWRIDKVRAVVARERPDVLEIHSPYVAAVSALGTPKAHFGIRTMQWHADFIDTYLLTSIERLVPGAVARGSVEPLWAWVRHIAEHCDALLVAARWQVDKLRAHGVPNIEYLPFGVDRDALSRASRSEALRREWLGSLPAETPVFVAVGRLAAEKQWPVVFEAFQRFRQDNAAVLVILGDGPERKNLEALAANRDDVRFLGFEKDRMRYATALASADVLVHGCPFETFGLSVAEAMTVGLPVVVPDRGGAAELADRASSEFFDAGDAEACAAAMRRILARDRASLRDAALDAGRVIPTADEQFAKLVALYGNLLEKRAVTGDPSRRMRA